MQDILSYSLFAIGERDFTLGHSILVTLIIIGIILVYRSLLKIYFPKAFESAEISGAEMQKFVTILRGLAILIVILALVGVLKLDRVLYATETFKLSVLPIVRTLLLFQFARLLYWVVSNVFIHPYYARRERSDDQDVLAAVESEKSGHRTVKYIFFLLVGMYMLQNFNLDPTLYERVIDGERVSFRFSNILQSLLIILIARFLIWLVTQVLLHNVYNKRNIVQGSQYAINQLIKYVVYIFAIILALDVFGINMNILLGGAAALLVGIGLGLQQTFNDFISGIVMLFERSVTVGDVLEVDGDIGTVREIGLRASILETRGNVSIVVPNHKLVNEKVVNWNHHSDKVRFDLDVGVAYGSDTSKVKKLLLKSVKDNPYVLDYPSPFVRFISFSNSSLDFKLFFFTRNLLVIEDIKSDIRLEIDKFFREEKISIPFPQREIRIVGDKKELGEKNENKPEA